MINVVTDKFLVKFNTSTDSNCCNLKKFHACAKYRAGLHGPPMLVDKTNFGLVLYNHANFYRFEETSSY